MAFTIPGRLAAIPKPHPRHRAVDRVKALEHELAGAGYLIDALRARLAKAEPKAIQADALKAYALGLEALLNDQTVELVGLRQAAATDAAVMVRQIGVRDTTNPLDQSTEPINVHELRTEMYSTTATSWQAGPVVTIGSFPVSADPGAIPTFV